MKKIFFKKDNVFYKIRTHFVEVFDLNSMTSSRIEELPENVKPCQMHEYRAAMHKYFNSKDFTWSYNGKSYTTCKIEYIILHRLQNDFCKEEFKSMKKEDYPIFYLGEVYTFEYFMSSDSGAANIRRVRDGKETITDYKNLKFVKEVSTI